MKKFRNIVCLVIILASASITATAQDAVKDNQIKFGRLLRLIESNYVDTANIFKLTEDAIINVLSELDPHSVYISKEDVAKMNEPLVGNFEGIGISFNIFKDTLLVTTTIAGGPSEKVGVLAGDRIVDIDGKNIAGIGLKNDDVFSMLRGPKGTKVNLKILRKDNDGLLDFTIIRDVIPIYSLDASFMLDKETGYIKLNKFSATTNDEFAEALASLKKKNIKNLILDLRDNGGGYMKAAIDISDHFLPSGKMIVYTEGKSSPKQEFKSTESGDFENGKLVVLINEGSASASEIVSGAVQDWDRGIIIGRRSYGKGLVQQPYWLNDGSQVRLTTSHYYTPSGRCIQKPYAGVKDYRQDYLKRIESGEMFSADSITFADSLKYKTLTNGRTVYGGGGIMPDLFVAMDTSAHYAYYNRLRRNNIVYTFVLDYIDKNRNELEKKYPDFGKFNTQFEVTAEMVGQMVANGEKEGIEKNEESLAFTMNLIKKELKALIARDLYSRHELYYILEKDDEAVLKALEVIASQKEYNKYLVTAH